MKQKAEETVVRSTPVRKSAITATAISEEVHSKGVQTSETAFVPCEACAKVQANLKQNADQLINMCYYQNIASLVGKYRSSLSGSQLNGGWLNGQDLEKWLAEQDKDLAKIAKQLEFMSKNSEMLRAKLAESEAAVQNALGGERELRKTLREEQELRVIQMKQYEKKLSDQKSEFQAKVSNLEAELATFNTVKSNLEQRLQSVSSLNDKNEKIIIELSKRKLREIKK